MKPTVIAVIVGGGMIAGALWFSNRPVLNTPVNDGSNITVIDGKQIIEIDAKGGYYPRETEAQAGIPTVFRVSTNGTFDCSSALVIPKLGYSKNLPPSGKTDIEIPEQIAGTTLQGLCAMGMYGFSVNFN